MNAQLRDRLETANKELIGAAKHHQAIAEAIAALAAPKEADSLVVGECGWIDPATRDNDSLIDCMLHNYVRSEKSGSSFQLAASLQCRNELSRRLAAPSKEAGPAGEFLGWVHECVWKDGTSRSLHQREPKLMDAIEPDGSPLAGLVSQRIVRVYANPPGDQRQEGGCWIGTITDEAGGAIDWRGGVLSIYRDFPPGTRIYANASPPPEAAAAVGGEALARRFHETYERLAPSFGYETRTETRQFDPTTANGRLMVAVCSELAALASPTGVDEMLRDLAENGLRYSLTPCLDWTSKDTINAFWMDYMMQADRSIRERATAVLAARDGGADHG